MIILLPTYNDCTSLEKTLKSISGCKLPDSYKELIVIENGGKFGADEIVLKYEESLHARYMYSEPGNKSIALNHALEQIDDDYIVFFDDDILVTEHILMEYERASEKYGKKHYFGGPSFPDYEKKPDKKLMQYLPHSAKLYTYGNKERRIRNALFMGYNWAAYSDDIKQAGGFNPNFGPGENTLATGQEKTMQKDLDKIGCRAIFLPKASVYHIIPEDECSLEWALKRYYKSGIYRGIEIMKRKRLSKKLSLLNWHIIYPVWLRIKSFFSRDREHHYEYLLMKSHLKGLFSGLLIDKEKTE